MVDNIAGENKAKVGVTWNGQYGELPDCVPYDATNGDVLAWVTEAVRGGGIPGIIADNGALFQDFVVDRFNATADRPWNLLQVRPKTPFGLKA